MRSFYPKKPGDAYFEALSQLQALPEGARDGAYVAVFERGERLSHLGEPVEALYCLASGRAKISMAHGDGRQTILQFIGAGDYVGDLWLLGVEDSPKDVEALCTTVAAALPMDRCRQALLTDAVFLRRLCEYLARKVLGRSERLTQNLNYPLKNRLAALILTAAHDGLYREKHAEAAEYLGVTYRHLLYTLAQFREEGLLERSQKGHRILDERALEALAGEIRGK
jgi:CRP-like cAMP-binding protein